METEKFLEMVKNLESKKKGKKEPLEKLEKLFDRFQLVNRNYLDKEAFEKSKGSLAAMAEAIVGTIRYLDDEIAHLRSKRMKLPFENVTLGEMQRLQKKNEVLIKEYLEGAEK